MIDFFVRIKIAIGHLYGKILFGDFGWKSFIFSPLRIIGGKYIHIGNRVSILNGLRIEAVEYSNGVHFNPNIEIGDDTDIEQNVHITCAEHVRIGDGCSILGGVTITDIKDTYEDINVAPNKQPLEVESVDIGDQSFIGMGARILPGVNIGRHCVIGANAVVTFDIPDFSVAVGVPARVVKRYNQANQIWEKL